MFYVFLHENSKTSLDIPCKLGVPKILMQAAMCRGPSFCGTQSWSFFKVPDETPRLKCLGKMTLQCLHAQLD